MKNIGLILSSVLAIVIGYEVVTSFMEAPERVADIIAHWSLTWLKGACITALITVIIFLINSKFSNEKTMSLIGMIVFTPLVPFLLWVAFGYNEWLLFIGSISGVIIGYFTYIIDDGMIGLWEYRSITIPIVLGLGFGSSVIIASITETWQDEEVYVTEHSVCTEVQVERYTSHTSSTSSGSKTTYSWDYYTSHYFFKKGDVYPTPIAPADFTLGTGYLETPDRYEYKKHMWIGGHKILSWRNREESDPKNIFKWIYNPDPIQNTTQIGKMYDIDENFFGHAQKINTIENQIYSAKDFEITDQALPTSGDVPGVLTMFWSFLKIMATGKDFALLRYIYLLVYLPFFTLMIFVKEVRVSFFIFLASSTIIILILIMGALKRSGGKLSDLDSRSFGGFRGGRFGGAGSGGRW